jgi:hypothetical protein
MAADRSAEQGILAAAAAAAREMQARVPLPVLSDGRVPFV